MKRLALLALLCWPRYALAGAWTQDAGSWQLITGATYSAASRSFDHRGDAVIPERSLRGIFQTYTEYGWDEGVTLFAQTDSVYARTDSGTHFDNGLGAGARLRLWRDDSDVVSVEIGARAAGAFNFSTSANSGQSGSDAELRLLYGRSFTWRGMNGFFDIEAAQRFMSAPRPFEMPLDLSAGLWLDDDQMLMVQNFNLVAEGHARAPFRYFRSHKLEVSGVRRLSARFLVQAGIFFSPAGQNALKEQGFCLALWTRF